MKRFVKLCAASFLALAVFGGGLAGADQPVKKRKPTFLEQLFGGSSDYRNQREYKRRYNRRSFDRRDGSDFGGIRVIDQRRGKAKNRKIIADDDPEGDPGYGMGNLRYSAPGWWR